MRGRTDGARDHGTAVDTRKVSGGKRKGKAMRHTPSEFRTGYVTREMLDKVQGIGAELQIDKRGRGHMITYKREA